MQVSLYLRQADKKSLSMSDKYEFISLILSDEEENVRFNIDIKPDQILVSSGGFNNILKLPIDLSLKEQV